MSSAISSARMMIVTVVAIASCGSSCFASPYVVEAVSTRNPKDYSSVRAAVHAAAIGKAQIYKIEIAPGRYHQAITIPKMAGRIILEGMGKTFEDVWIGVGKGKHALTVHADNFVAENLTVENTAGPTAGPQNAIYMDGRHQIFDHVDIKGWQDTLAIWNGCTSYFTHCRISGSVDFIYSGGTAYFSHCAIIQRRRIGGVNCAPSTPKNVQYGFIFHRCWITCRRGVARNSSALMRPWRPYGMAAYINCTMADHINRAGWSRWGGREKTCRAIEFGSRRPDGRLINLAERAPWVKRLTREQARVYTLTHIFPHWNPRAVLQAIAR